MLKRFMTIQGYILKMKAKKARKKFKKNTSTAIKKKILNKKPSV
jgi:hypothetical protein